MWIICHLFEANHISVCITIHLVHYLNKSVFSAHYFWFEACQICQIRCDRGCTAQLHWGRVQFLFTSYFPTKSENCTGCLCNGTPHTFYTPGHFLCIVQKSCLRDLTLETLCPQQENKRSFFFILHFWRSEENVPIKQIFVRASWLLPREAIFGFGGIRQMDMAVMIFWTLPSGRQREEDGRQVTRWNSHFSFLKSSLGPNFVTQSMTDLHVLY